MNCVLHFVYDDADYLAWLSGHPDGLVINTYSSPSPAYLKLHQATCSRISRLQPDAKTLPTVNRRSTDGQPTVSTARSAAIGTNWKRTLTIWVDHRGPARFASDSARVPRGISGYGCLWPGLPDKGSLSV